MILYYLSLLAFFYSQAQHKPPVSFTEEYIEFRLKKDIFTVNGIYVFVNNTNGYSTEEIHYPFPATGFSIDSVHVFDMNHGKYLETERRQKDVVFRLNVPPKDTLKLNIFYRQKGVKDTATYILTTTKNWGEPLRKGEYTFTTDASRKIRSFSYPPDKKNLMEKEQKYFWSRKDFLPEKDFIVVFEKK
jgi:hypothetical protein